MTSREDKPVLLPDTVEEILDFQRLKDTSLLEPTLYRCLEMYFAEKGETGLEKLLLMWDDISHRSRREPNEK